MNLEKRKLQAQGLGEDEIQKKLPGIQEEISKMVNSRLVDSLPIDLRHVPVGRYTVEIAKDKKVDLYVSDSPGDQRFGVIELYLTGPGKPPENCLVGEAITDEEGAGLCHVINFQARTTYWRYLFVNYNGSNVEAIEVRDEENEVEFSKPRADVLEYVGKPTLIVESQVPLQLQERPKQEFWLKRTKGKRNIKDIKLPTPAADTIRPLKQEDGTYKVVSDIYVYL